MQDWQRSSKHMLPSYNISLARAGCVLRHMRKGMEWYSTLSYSLAPFPKPYLLGIFWNQMFDFFEIFKGNWIGLRLCLNADETCPAKFSHVATLILSIHITSGSSVKNIGAESEVMACTERKIWIQQCDNVLWLWIPCEFHVATCCNRTKQWSFGECSGVPLSFCGNDACTNRGRIWCCQSVPIVLYYVVYVLYMINIDLWDYVL